MRRKKLHISLLLVLFYTGYPGFTSAQLAISLPETNISSRTDYTVTLASGTYTNVLGLIPTVDIKANTANFSSTVGGTTTVALNVANLRLRSIGALAVLGGSTERALTTSYQNIYTALASVASGQVTVDYRIATSPQTWIAGIYRAPIQFRTSVLTPNQISPTTPNLDITVPSFITPQASLGIFSLSINSLSFFRTTEGASSNKSITVSNTVPYTLSLQADNTQFAFSTSFPSIQTPVTAASSVSATLSGISSALSISLSNSSQAITNTAGITVPVTNNQTLNAVLSISGANLKLGFKQAGTYTLPLTYTWNKLNATYPVGNLQVIRNTSLQVTVSDLSEIVANQNVVSLNFNTAASYQQGLTTPVPAHLRVSRTTPYTVYVRAGSNSFSSGSNSIPLSVMRIGPAAGQTGMNTITLSTTSQLLLNTAEPVIDRNLSVQYSIPASQTSALLGKPAGTYSSTVIYSFVAL